MVKKGEKKGWARGSSDLSWLSCLCVGAAEQQLPHESREFILHSWRVLEHYNPTGKFVDVITIGGLACVIRWETPHRSILVDNSTASDGIFLEVAKKTK
jgi:hypothetical protein